MALDLSKSATVTPPPRKSTPKTSSAGSMRQSMKTAEREEGLNGLFQIGAAITMMVGSPLDAATVVHHGPNISREAAKLAETNESFARVLDYISSAGPYAAIITVSMPLALQILVNHKRIPSEPFANFGVMPPETLSAKISAEASRQQMQLMQEAQEAEAEAARIASKLAEAKADAS